MNSDNFFKYATERYSVLLSRVDGDEKPWTEDEILQQYRFCNVFREDDVVTEWIRHHIREPMHQDFNVLMAMVICRFINRVESLELIKGEILEHLKHQSWTKTANQIRKKLENVQPLITGAYMIKTPANMCKLEGLLKIFRPIVRDAEHMCMRIEEGDTTLEQLHLQLCQYDFVGPFMAYEIVTDMRHTHFMKDAPDINTWASAGPGAARGMSRILYHEPNRINYTSPSGQRELLGHMQELLRHSRRKRNWRWQSRPWEMREVEHTLCEFDKYERVRLGEGKPKQKYNGA